MKTSSNSPYHNHDGLAHLLYLIRLNTIVSRTSMRGKVDKSQEP